MTAPPTAWERWGPQLPFGVLVVVLGLVRAPSWGSHNLDVAAVSVAIGAAAALSRRLPAGALGLAWSAGLVQVLMGTPVLTLEVTLVVVAYGCARWGSAATVVASGLSIPLGGVIALPRVGDGRLRMSALLEDRLYRLSDQAPGLALLTAVAGIVTILLVPWLAGLAVRSLARAQRSEVGEAAAQEQAVAAQQQTEQAQEIARLRDEQARLARDVHDVVGHSLAVILAQAESAQYLPDVDAARLKQTLATIATSARGSLQDVRQVLDGPGQAPHPAAPGRFEQLLDGVRAGGHEVVATEVGVPRPLPPELEVVAHRVAQEMLTNAIKHGRRGAAVRVERHWPEGAWDRDLRIEVRNVADPPPPPDETQPIQSTDGPPDPLDGRGLDGMRRRLDSVGGRLDVRRRDEPDGPTFTATAWVPVTGR